jgi:hypothetical protein
MKIIEYEDAGFYKYGEFINHVSNYKLVKKAPSSYYMKV